MHARCSILKVPHWLAHRCFVQVLGESMAGISQNCKTGNVSSFGDCVGSASKALCGLTEAAGQVKNGHTQLQWCIHFKSILVINSSEQFFKLLFYFPQASYLVGVSDPNSQAGHQGLVDPIQFAKANQAIQMACQNLVDPDSSPSQVCTIMLHKNESIKIFFFFKIKMMTKRNVSFWCIGAVGSYHCC